MFVVFMVETFYTVVLVPTVLSDMLHSTYGSEVCPAVWRSKEDEYHHQRYLNE